MFIATQRRKSCRALSLLAAAALMACGVAQTAPADTTATWNGATGDWTTAADWSSNPNYPDNGAPAGVLYDVIIDSAGTGAYTLGLDSTAGISGTVNVNSLTIDNANATLDQTSGTLDLAQLPGGTTSGAFDIQAGTYDLNGGTLADAVLTIGTAGSFADSNGTLQNVTLGSDLTISSSSGYVYVANTLANPLGLDLNGHSVNITGNGRLIYRDARNTTTGQYLGDSINGDVNLSGNGSNISVGNGGLTIDSGATVTASSGSYSRIMLNNLTNNGTIAVNNQTSLSINSNLTNSGTVAISGSNSVLTLNGTWTNTGTIEADSNATIAATETINLGGSFSSSDISPGGSGTGGTVTANGATVNITGTLNNTGNTLTFNSGTGVWNLSGTIENGTLNAANQSNGASCLSINSGTLQNVTLGSDLTISSSSGYVYVANTLANPLGLDLNGHSVNITGNGRLIYRDARNTTTGQYLGDSINGDVNLSGNGSNISVGNGGLTIDSGATVTASSGSYSRIMLNNLTNNGTIAVDNQTSFDISSNLTNNSLVQATAGASLDLGSLTTNSGTVAISGSNSVLTLGGTWSNTGTIEADSNATIAATETINFGGTFTSSAVGLQSSGTGGTVTANGATVNITGTLDNTGNTLTFNSGTGVWNLTSSGTIENGTLNAANQSNGASYLNINSYGTLQNVTLGSDLTIASNGYVFIANTAANPVGLNFNGHSLNFTGSAALRYQDARNSGSGQYVGDSINGGVNLSGNNSGITGGQGGLAIDSGATVTASSGGNNSIQSNGALTNNGTIAVDNQTSLDINSNLTNSGTVAISGSNSVLTLNGTWTNTGTIEADSNATIAAAETINFGGTFTSSAAGLQSSGTGGTVTANGATVNITGTLDNTGNTLTFNSGTGVWNLTSSGTIENGTLNAANQSNGASYLNINSYGTLQNVTLGSDLTIASNGYVFIANTAANPVGLNFNGHSLNFTGSAALRYQDARNSGSGQYVGDSINGGVNLSGNNSGITGGQGGLAIDSGATVTASSGGNNSIQSNGALTNNGTIAVDNQTSLDINSNLTNNGLVQAAAGASLNIGTLTNNSGATVSAQGGTVDVTGTTGNTGTIASSNGGTLQISTGKLSNYSSGTLTGGIYIAAGGTLTISGAAITTNAADVTLNGSGSVFAQISPLAVNQGEFRVLGGLNFTTQAGLDNQTGALLQLGGGTFGITSGSLTNEGTIQGFGTVTPQVTNTGTIEATGGTLALSAGVLDPGVTSTLQSDPGATLNLSAGTAGLTPGLLINNGNLTLGANNVTVNADYQNANFGSGNSFNALANVSSTGGKILSAGNADIAVTGNVTPTSSTAGLLTYTMAFGEIHSNSTATLTYQIENSGTTGPTIRGAIQTDVNGGTLTDARLGGAGAAGGNFSVPIGQSAALPVAFNPNGQDGPLSGQVVHLEGNFPNIHQANITITGTAFNLAVASVSPTTTNVGDVRVGAAIAENITVQNTAQADGFSESLNGQLGAGTGNAVTNGGTFNALAAGATLTPVNTLTIGLNTSTAGDLSGSAALALQSDGTGIDTLGKTSLTSQTITINAAAYNLAVGTVSSPTTINLGDVRVGDAVAQNITVQNSSAADGFSENLDGQLGAGTGNAVTNNGTFSALAAGATLAPANTLTIGLNTGTAGNLSGSAALALQSDGTGIDTLGKTTLNSQTINITAAAYNLAAGTITSPTTINVGNVHVGDTIAQNITVQNTAAADGFSENLDGQLGAGTGNAVTNGGTFSALAAGATLAPANTLTIGLNTSTAGNLSGSAALALQSDGTGIDTLGKTALASQTIDITAAAYNLAAGTITSPTTINLGIVHPGDVAEEALTVQNAAPAGAFSEGLDAQFGTLSGNAMTNGGSVALLSAGGSNNSSLVVGVNTTTAGAKTGTAQVEMQSDGQGTSGLGKTVLANSPVTINVSAQVNNYAAALLLLGTHSTGASLTENSSTLYTLDLGTAIQGKTNLAALLQIENSAIGPADTLAGNFNTSNAAAFSLSGFGSFSNIAAGTSNSNPIVSLSNANTGNYSGSITLNPFSQNSSGYNGALSPITIDVSGSVVLAGELIWDRAGTSPTAPADGFGTWNTASGLWSNGASDAAWNNSADSTVTATFGADNGVAGTVTLGAAVQAGGLTFNPATSSHYTIAGSGSYTLELTGAAVTANAAATLSAETTFDKGLTLNGGSTLTLAGNDTLNGPTTIRAGAITLAAGGKITGTSGLVIAPGAALNLDNVNAGNGVTIDYGSGTSPNSTIQGYIASGAITAPTGYAVGYADGADGVVGGLSAGQEKIMATLPGDANLAGVVNNTDLALVLNNLNQSSGGLWTKGDFTGSGTVTNVDLATVLSNLNRSLSTTSTTVSASAAAISYSSVPEPTELVLLSIAGALALLRRRGLSKP